MEITKEIKEAVLILNKVDEYNESLPLLISNNDLAISDLYHYIENNMMNTKSSYRIVKELKEKLKERRKLKNEQDILRTFYNQKQRLLETNNRNMILANLGKEEKKLQALYKNRIYDKKELKQKKEG